MWPCWWSTALAAYPAHARYPDPRLLALFLIGSFAMRGAGCAYNDLLDRDIDAKVERTRLRPLPSGQMTSMGAVICLIGLCLLGLVVLLQLNRFAQIVGLLSLVPVAVYPLMKRITYWPQAVLGLSFGWGALIGWAAVLGSLSLAPILLYVAAIAWIMGYDTIYAHQDKEDDAVIGVKSTALAFGTATRPWLCGFYGLFILLTGAALGLVGGGSASWLALSAVAVQLTWQILTLDISDPANCLARFRSNHPVGAILFAGLVVDLWSRG
jgi:4-hydroxybenzoate polyprenyltransferase